MRELQERPEPFRNGLDHEKASATQDRSPALTLRRPLARFTGRENPPGTMIALPSYFCVDLFR
jgi:hypothetical protein